MRAFLLIFLFLPALVVAQKHRTPMPEKGTMFVNTYYVTDSSGNLVPKSVANAGLSDDTLFVIKSNAKFFGRPHCMEYTAKSHPDTTLVSYAANGDIYMRYLRKDSVWHQIPFGMTPHKFVLDSLAPDSGMMLAQYYYMPHQRTTEVLGTDTISVEGKVYNCIVLQIVDIRQYQDKDWYQETMYWYSPDLGYFVRQNEGWNGPYFLNQQLKIWRPPEQKTK